MSEQSINVWYGSRENADLSNLAHRPFTYEGMSYISVEHAYQCLKSGKMDNPLYAKDWRAGSKHIGRLGTRTQDNWNLKLMYNLIQASLEQNPEIVSKLVDTQGKEITHTQDRGVWKTAFPSILMCLREHFAKESTHERT